MEPDYSKYATSKLLEALDSIDHSEYPERVKLIKFQLEQREVLNEKVKDDDALSSREKSLVQVDN